MQQTASAPAQSPHDLRPLDDDAIDRLLAVVSQFEGEYWSLNLDEEFEGRFDQPVQDGSGGIPVAQRHTRPDFVPNPHSKFGPSPGHVGLSFGFIQFTQESGSLGALLSRMRDADAAAFASIFGPDGDALVEVTNRTGVPVPVDDPASPTGKARRSPQVAAVGGADLWKEPWPARFIAAGKHPPFQRVQREQAALKYFKPMVAQAAIPYRVMSQKGLCILLDRSVQLGVVGCARLLLAVWGAGPHDTPEAARFDMLYRNVQHKPWSRRMRRILDGAETSFELRYQLA